LAQLLLFVEKKDLNQNQDKGGDDMAALYPSDEWIKDLQRVCNEDPRMKEVGGNYSASFVFEIEADQNLKEPAYLYFWPDKGVVKDSIALKSLDEKPDATYVIAGKYSNWKNLVKGKMAPLRMITTRKLRVVKGSQIKLLQNVKLSLRVMHNCLEVPCEFVDEKA
jgi:putative sterol carrier protein